MAYPSPATLLLLQRGISPLALAEAADMRRPTVSQQLTGQSTLSDEVRSAILELSGGDEAFVRQVAALAKDSHAARREH